MNRLQTEFRRLYHSDPAQVSGAGIDPEGLIDDQGRVRAMVLELARPADWEQLAGVWRGVQTDLGLPAPAIAVSGTDGLQLWFSLSEPLGVAPAHAFLVSLRGRYLPDVALRRVSLMPALDALSTSGQHARAVPALNESTGNWSAFVAPDLAPIFADTPWLDLPPGDDGQANLLSRLASIKPAMFAAALAQLEPAAGPAVPGPLAAGSDTRLVMSTHKVVTMGHQDPREFLLAVMNDEAVSLALRIEAAKALLP
jgi:hypothetical protein